MATSCRIKINRFPLPAGADKIEITEDNLGYKLDGEYGNFQVTCQGLGGTTYSVSVLVPGSPDVWVTVPGMTGKGAADFVHIDEKFLHRGIRVVPVDAGLGVDMVATICASGRKLCFSHG